MTPARGSRMVRSIRRERRGGFTLVEMIISLVIVSIIMVGMGGALLMSSQALPGEDSRTDRITAAADVAEQIASELTYAISVTELTSTAVTFTVADRDSDSNPETIRYAWSGTAGDPLTRQYNGGGELDVAEDVHAFDLACDLRTETTELPPETVEGDEFLLASRDPVAIAADYVIKDRDWIAQYFVPVLPVDAEQWVVTRVLVMVRYHGGTKSITAVQLRSPDASNQPSSTVLEEVLMYESNLDASYAWEEFYFTQVTGLTPGKGLCLVLARHQKDADLADVQYDAGGGSGLLTTSDAGSSWTVAAGQSMQFFVYGKTAKSVAQPPEIRSWLRSAIVSLQIGPDTATRVETAARVLNEPEVTP
ncbi:MAG: prepilin-type N-terminal cleavage/methylation domain-containing protein [Phycisphaerales bacterium]|nr:MAG: prepilin-type N-terminal cleavage/methylation domain-containing protein [Phycisphaerales bacterium]